MTDALVTRLGAQVDALPSGALLLGYSGGLDSSVLLHLLAALPQARARGLRALHVDHGLQPQSAAWAAHCLATAAALDVPCDVERVHVDTTAGLGLEAAARNARHAAFARRLAPDDIAVFAQHRDDQVETLLLRLLHGAGHEGLAAMRAWRRFGTGWLWRPLLDVPRASLAQFAQAHGIDAIHDPSNDDPRFARNRLRHRVLPALREAWPDADTRIAATGQRLRDEADALDTIATHHLAHLQDADNTLSCSGLRALPDALRRHLLGRWLDSHGLPRPPPGLWTRVTVDLLDARPDATPLLAWRGAELRRYRDRLHAMPPHRTPPDWRRAWDGNTPLTLPHDLGTLQLDPPYPFDTPVTVASRTGGERLTCRGIHRPLRLLLQEHAVPPWQRERLPLLSDPTGTLLAAGDVLQSDTFAQWLRHHATTLRWTPAPIRAH